MGGTRRAVARVAWRGCRLLDHPGLSRGAYRSVVAADQQHTTVVDCRRRQEEPSRAKAADYVLKPSCAHAENLGPGCATRHDHITAREADHRIDQLVATGDHLS